MYRGHDEEIEDQLKEIRNFFFFLYIYFSLFMIFSHWFKFLSSTKGANYQTVFIYNAK